MTLGLLSSPSSTSGENPARTPRLEKPVRLTWRRTALLLLLVDLLLVQAVAAGSGVGEDAFISLRYAENLATGAGFRFNPADEKPCEGFSNLLWVVLLAGAKRMGVSSTFGAQLGGLLCALATLGALFALGLHLRLRLYWLAPLSLSLNAHFIYYSTYGLETALFTLLVVLGVSRSIRYRPTWPSTLVAFVPLALLALVRPEGIAVALTIAGALWLLALRRGNRREARRPLCLVVSLAGVFAALLVWRYSTFESISAAPTLTKLFRWHPGVESQLAAGLRYLGAFLTTNPAMAVALGCLLLRAAPARTRRAALLNCLPAALLLGAVVAVGGDAVYFLHFRFFVPVLPGLLLAAAIALDSVPVRSPLWRAALGIAAVIASLFYIPYRVDGLRFVRSTPAFGILFDSVRDAGDLASRLREGKAFRVDDILELRIGRWLRDNVDRRALLATGQAGNIPYHSNLPAVDFVGLASCDVAQAGSLEAVSDLLRLKHPDLFLLMPSDVGYRLMPNDYELSRIFRAGRVSRSLLLFARRGFMPCVGGGDLLRQEADGRTFWIRRSCVLDFFPAGKPRSRGRRG
jgi:arabinofuranosyltransferase